MTVLMSLKVLVQSVYVKQRSLLSLHLARTLLEVAHCRTYMYNVRFIKNLTIAVHSYVLRWSGFFMNQTLHYTMNLTSIDCRPRKSGFAASINQ